MKGEKILIAKGGKPLVKLVKIQNETGKRVPGKLRGKIWIAPDFDELPTLKNYLYIGSTLWKLKV